MDIYDTGFQNWLKGVLGLNNTRAALCECVSGKFNDYVKDISPSELKQFFCCLKENEIAQLEMTRTGVKTWKCKHDSCRVLMDRFVDNHTEKSAFRYIWKKESIVDSNIGNEDTNSTWNVIMLYMHSDRNGSAGNYNSLDCLDISHVIKVMRNCKLFDPEESDKFNELRDLYEEVIQSRNKLMHSSNNIMNEVETHSILKGARTILGCLNISEETYYKEAIQNLYDLEEKDFFIKYQSEEYKKILEEVLEAKEIAENLYKYIGDENQDSKRQSIELQHKLEKIGGLRSAATNGLEIKPAEYKSIIKSTLEKKQKIIVMDKAEFDVESETYKKLVELEHRTEREIEEIKDAMQKSDPEELVEKIDILNKEVEILKDKKKQTKEEETRLKIKMEVQTKEIKNLTRDIEFIEHENRRIEEEVEKYKVTNETLKASTSIFLKGIEPHFQHNIDIMPRGTDLDVPTNCTSEEGNKEANDQVTKEEEEQVENVDDPSRNVISIDIDRSKFEEEGINITKQEEQEENVEDPTRNDLSMEIEISTFENEEIQFTKQQNGQVENVETLTSNIKYMENDRRTLEEEDQKYQIELERSNENISMHMESGNNAGISTDSVDEELLYVRKPLEEDQSLYRFPLNNDPQEKDKLGEVKKKQEAIENIKRRGRQLVQKYSMEKERRRPNRSMHTGGFHLGEDTERVYDGRIRDREMFEDDQRFPPLHNYDQEEENDEEEEEIMRNASFFSGPLKTPQVERNEEEANKTEQLSRMELSRRRVREKEDQKDKMENEKREENAHVLKESGDFTESVLHKGGFPDRKTSADDQRFSGYQNRQGEETFRGIIEIALTLYNTFKKGAYLTYEDEGRSYFGLNIFLCSDDGIYSLSHRSEFVIDDRKFWCVLQYILYKNAELSRERRTAKKILDCNATITLHEIERRFESGSNWAKAAFEGCLAKFEQNEEFNRKLLRTKSMEIGFASEDDMWGIGLPIGHPDSRDSRKWKGQNILGNILTQIRNGEKEYTECIIL